jgi:RNA polymerase sigma-54 factor
MRRRAGTDPDFVSLSAADVGSAFRSDSRQGVSMNAPVIRHEQRQTQSLTPRLQQAVRLLQLSSLDFAQEVQQAIGSNPFLDVEEPEGEASANGEKGARASAIEADGDVTVAVAEGVPAAPEQITQLEAGEAPWEGEAWSQFNRGDGQSSPRLFGGLDVDAGELTPMHLTLRDHLHRQIGVQPLSDRDAAIVRAIIESLDEDGYLRIDLEEVGHLIGADPVPEMEEMQVALRLVQSLDPAGVGARDLRECLLLQLEDQHIRANGHAESPIVIAKPGSGISEQQIRHIARNVVDRYLANVAAREFTCIARELGVPSRSVDLACECIRHLDPRPGWRFGALDVRYVTPDVVVRKVHGVWAVALNPAVVPRVSLNHTYAALFRQHRDSRHADLAAQLQEARWMVRNVEQRFSTILQVAEAIVARQRQYFEHGELAMRPLGLKEIADEVGMHESTVSRVTNNKYMDTPNGIVELKFFFSRALPDAQGGSASATAIRGVIKDLIAAENPRTPLSDAQIARLLARQGLRLARRTVTKYRQMLQVPPVELRRQRASLQ